MEWESSGSRDKEGGSNKSIPSTANSLSPEASSKQPFLEILIQPQPKFRFRYKSEMTGKHGSLLGVVVSSTSSSTGSNISQEETNRTTNSTSSFDAGQGTANSSSTTPSSTTQHGGGSKIYPTVKLHNVSSPAIIRVSLVCHQPPYYPHPHLLDTPTSQDDRVGHCDLIASGEQNTLEGHHFIEIPVSSDNDFTAVFQNLTILHTSKKSLRRVLQSKLSHIQDPSRKLKLDQLDDLMGINLNEVALYFEAFGIKEGDSKEEEICRPIVSWVVRHNKNGELRIVRIDKFSSVCTGNEEVFILVEKVDKHNIQIKFFEENGKGVEIWKDYGKFGKLDVHHQYAIVFKTPPYRTLNIDSEIDVWIQLERPTDGAKSQRIPFQYRPVEQMRKLPKRQMGLRAEGGREPESGERLLMGGGSGSDSAAGGGRGTSGPNVAGSSSTGSSSSIRQGSASMMTTSQNQDVSVSPSKQLAIQVALSISQGLHSWAESSDMSQLLQKLRHLLCLLDENGDSALHTSIVNAQLHPFHLILSTLSSSEDTMPSLNQMNHQLLTPIHLAVLTNQPEFVLQLLQLNVDISLQDSDGNTPLHSAVKMNNVPLVKYLLESATAVDAMCKLNYAGLSPLHIAVVNGLSEMVGLLSGYKQILHLQEGTYGRTALHLAVERGDVPCMMQLLRCGLDPNIQNYRGDTVLHCAGSMGNGSHSGTPVADAMCAGLMLFGADPFVENHVTGLDQDEEEKIENIVQAESSNNDTSFNNSGDPPPPGQTPLDVASSNDKILRILKGNVECWETILKDCSLLVVDKDKDNFDKLLDSGIDVTSLNNLQGNEHEGSS